MKPGYDVIPANHTHDMMRYWTRMTAVREPLNKNTSELQLLH